MAQRKIFTAERQLMARRMGAANGNGANLIDPSGVTNAELLEAIEALSEDLANGQLVADGPPEADETSALSPTEQEIRAEVAQMVRLIGRTKAEIASIKHPKADDDRIKAASNELDAIVVATETATEDILESAEKIEELTAKIAAHCADDEELVALTDQITNHVTSILQSCGFQDITGQRVTKVVKTIQFIKDRIIAMIDIWGVEAFTDLPVPTETEERGADGTVLSGPQLDSQGITQADIDALFD